ncbi:Inner membrane protein [Sodalis praecaptivus]|uniref:Inner membrane protein n=1 Tax=Sodalis praecaptivus TaxID=1239307 RepID=W0HY46_9GAMM|nr:DUF2569 family protein [Sodalis praecaptivus]AHF77073.1 Inner membrane protein [Sodalis praecaptivus]
MPVAELAPRPIGGWLWAVVAWLGMTLLSATAMLLVYLWFLLQHAGALTPAALASLLTSGAMWLFTFWLLRLLFRRSRRFPRLLILWLLVGVLLGIKTFAFAPVSDNLALRVLFPPVLAAAVLVPYIKRSQRVRQTFILP